VKEGSGREEEDSNPPLVSSTALIGSYPDQEVVPKEAAPDEIPSSWKVLFPISSFIVGTSCRLLLVKPTR
jgi:hypothetical protein